MDEVSIHERLTKVEESAKSAHHRLDTMDEKMDAIETKQDIMHEMNTNIKLIAVNQENQGKEIVSIKCDVKELKEKPGKRWDEITAVIIAAVATGIIGFILGKVLGT